MPPRAAALAGLGTFLPPRQVTNDDLAARLDTSDEWIRSRTGIRTRHWVEPGTSTGDLAVEAGRRALASAGLGSVDLVVVATTTPDHPCPATAPDVAARLGLEGVAAYDVAAVCSGFVYAVATAGAQVVAGQVDRALVIGAETYSTILNPDDRTTSVIFGDGAGAVVLSVAEDPGQPGIVLGTDLGSDGTGRELIQVPGGGSRQRSRPGEEAPDDRYFTMQGAAVFAAAVSRMTTSSTRVLDRVGWATADVDHLVGHQANVRILAMVAQGLGIPEDRTVVNIDRVGNTSAASIPLALADAASAGRLRPGSRVLLTAFGGGLTWGSVALTWPDIVAR